jgi:U3 small nucleolar RNA-associated protein 22
MHKTHKIVVPFPDPKPNKDAAYGLAYSRPSDINVVGSYALQTMTKEDPNLVIDVVVTLPGCILQEKDYLNYRYFYKRSFYISCIAAGLQEKAGDEFEMCFEYLGDNNLQPVLILKPRKCIFSPPIPVKC